MKSPFNKNIPGMSFIRKKKSDGRHLTKWKVPARYRLTFYNENSLTNVWSIAMGRRRVICVLALIVFVIVCVGASLISFTPLRTLLPGYLRNAERREYIEASLRADSLLSRLAANEYYLANINLILDGDIPVDSASMARTIIEMNDTISLIPTSEEEKQFVRAYREREGFTLADAERATSDIPVFVRPVRNATITIDKNGDRRFTFDADKSTVYAIARSVVIDLYGDKKQGYTVLLQHPDGYVSRYSGLAEVYFNRGQSVSSGARLGLYDATTHHPFTFDLTLDGRPLNLSDYIPLD